MKFSKCFQLAISNILSSKARSFLTMLGIIIGIMSVITLVSLMNGITNEVTTMFDEMGTTAITVSVQGRGDSRQVTADDVYDVADEYPELISGVSPSVSVMASIRSGDDPEDMSTTVSGVSEVYGVMTKTVVEQGSFFDYIDVERMSNVCVIGTYVERYLFGRSSALGEVIKINGNPYTVVGILQEMDDSSKGSRDECVYIPYTNATRLVQNAAINSFNVYANSEHTVDGAVNVIEARLHEILGDSDYYMVISMKQIRDAVNDITGMLTMALVFIAGISSGAALSAAVKIAKREENADIAYYFQNYFSLLSTNEKIGISAYVLKLQFVENKLIFKEEEYISRP